MKTKSPLAPSLSWRLRRNFPVG